MVERPGCQLPSRTPAYEPGVEHRLGDVLARLRRPAADVQDDSDRDHSGARVGRGHLSRQKAGLTAR